MRRSATRPRAASPATFPPGSCPTGRVATESAVSSQYIFYPISQLVLLICKLGSIQLSKMQSKGCLGSALSQTFQISLLAPTRMNFLQPQMPFVALIQRKSRPFCNGLLLFNKCSEILCTCYARSRPYGGNARHSLRRRERNGVQRHGGSLRLRPRQIPQS